LWPMAEVGMYRSFGIALTALTDLIAIGFLMAVYIFRRSLRERGQAAKELQAYADQLRTGAELKSQLSQIAAEMQKAETLAALAQVFLYEVAPLTGISYGAFYILDEQDGLLKSIGSYGRPEEKDEAGPFAVGQGLVGQCARERTPLDITAPQPGPVRVTWGGGQLYPAEILLWPVLQSDRVLGVIELASLQPFTAAQRTLLENLMPITALNIEILRRNLRTRELLEQSRSQAAALAASEQQLIARQAELEEQKELLLAQHQELEKSREMMKRAEERSRAILNAISVGTVIIDPATRTITDVNPIAARMIGLAREDIIGSTCHKFICPRELHDCPIIDLGQKVDNADRVLLTAGGAEIPVLKTVAPVLLGDREYLLESFVDISEQKAMEEDLKHRMEELERFTKLTVDREEKMIALKEEINALLTRLGQEAKYKIVE
ncbi:MAG TPA: GAF domain-containing protein, partial [Syntrophales bacterium]|nr:GAF domain-containing protein [Syntrophales bacterium]